MNFWQFSVWIAKDTWGWAKPPPSGQGYWSQAAEYDDRDCEDPVCSLYYWRGEHVSLCCSNAIQYLKGYTIYITVSKPRTYLICNITQLRSRQCCNQIDFYNMQSVSSGGRTDSKTFYKRFYLLTIRSINTLIVKIINIIIVTHCLLYSLVRSQTCHGSKATVFWSSLYSQMVRKLFCLSDRTALTNNYCDILMS